VLRFRESREPREREDVYEDETPSLRERLQPAWLWTRRILTVGVLVAALAYAVRERDVWFPRTAELGQTVFTEIDRQVLSRERQEERQRALADAGGRLPGLAPQTIEALFSRSPTGLAEAGEVFQLAREAADRGFASLAPAEAEELRALERELLGALSRTEAERVREYDDPRAAGDLPVRKPPRDGARRAGRGAAGAPRAPAGADAQAVATGLQEPGKPPPPSRIRRRPFSLEAYAVQRSSPSTLVAAGPAEAAPRKPRDPSSPTSSPGTASSIPPRSGRRS
jgi:hypothetical protein